MIFCIVLGEKGDKGIIGPQGPEVSYFGISIHESKVIIFLFKQGKQGPIGLTGDKGDQGIIGPVGEKGLYL